MVMPAVNPEILIWARETAGLTPDLAVKKLAIRDTQKASALDRLAGYESGAEEPSRPLLLRMSTQYRRPLLTFYLPKPPQKGDSGTDFRTLPQEDKSPTATALLDTLIRDVQARQSMVRAVLEDEDEIPSLSFVGSRTIGDGEPAVLSSLQTLLDVQLNDFRSQPDANGAFNLLRACAEREGIFVLLKGDLGSYHTAIGLETFRGFSIADNIAPFIVINDRDARAAWTFTMLHEIVHLILGQTGVSGHQSGNDIERFCDDVASKFLLSEYEAEQIGLTGEEELDDIASRISEFAEKRNISRAMVAYRAYRADNIKHSQYQELAGRFRAEWIQQRDTQRQQQAKNRGPNPYTVRRHRLGRKLTSLVSRMMQGGELSTSRAARILGVRPGQVQATLAGNGRA